MVEVLVPTEIGPDYAPPASPRVERLRDSLVAIRRYDTCSERALLVTESYKETEGQPYIIRRAKAFDKLLRNMTIFILDDELIVGHRASMRKGVPFCPEIDVDWIEKELNNRERDSLSGSCPTCIEFLTGLRRT
ncbi:MAG TPA: hypothetical protein G4O03_07065 [Dehalococcoidia bacterium]|nr:hypothetical protein [Dehalococcoidia bacterium]